MRTKKHFTFNINGRLVKFKTIPSGESRGSCSNCYFNLQYPSIGCPRINMKVNRSSEQSICEEASGFNQLLVFALNNDYSKRIEMV